MEKEMVIAYAYRQVALCDSERTRVSKFALLALYVPSLKRIFFFSATVTRCVLVIMYSGFCTMFRITHPKVLLFLKVNGLFLKFADSKNYRFTYKTVSRVCCIFLHIIWCLWHLQLQQKRKNS